MKKIIFTIITLFVFTSSVNAYDLTISNLQDDSASNTYTYKLNVYKATGAYQYIYNNNESYIVFDATGNTTFTLQNNEMIIIKNLPESLFQIEQIPNNKYITYTNDKKINTLSSNTKETTEIEDIASAISDALKDDKPINLTNFEEDQERTAIISIDELMKRAKELELVEDEQTGINYLEKYNLEAAEVEDVIKNTMKDEKPKEVKAFKVSQVISPIYGVRKDIVDNNE